MNSRKTAYQTVLVISATLSILSVIMIFSTFPVFYQYFHRVKLELTMDIRSCKNTAETVYFFVNRVSFFDSKRLMLLGSDNHCNHEERRNRTSFLLS